MAKESEKWFILSDGIELYEKTWEPAGKPHAHLIFLHGFSDRSELQYHLFPTLASEPYNITCHAIDQRGWGKSVRSTAQRGNTGPTAQVLADIDEYIAYVSANKIQDTSSTPLFIMGHSMGGQEVLCYVLSTSLTLASRSKLAGAIVEAPLVGLDPSSQPSSLLVMAGKVAAMISPRSQMTQKLSERYISRDPNVNRAWKEDPLCHDTGTLEMFRDMLGRSDNLVTLGKAGRHATVPKTLALSRRSTLPMFWAHGTSDRITAFDPAKKLFDSLEGPSKVGSSKTLNGMTFKAYEEAYHKIHAEPDGVGVAFAKDVGDWIMRVVAATARRDGDRGHQLDITTDVPDPVGRGPGQGGEQSLKAKL